MVYVCFKMDSAMSAVSAMRTVFAVGYCYTRTVSIDSDLIL